MQVSKVCTVCSVEKNIEDYPLIQKKWVSNICKSCVLKKQKAWRDNHLEYFNTNQKERTKANKLKAIKYLGGKCQDCGGVFHHAVYDFHHKNPEEKEISPNKMMGRAFENMIKELDKCVLLCSNCHRLRHHGGEE